MRVDGVSFDPTISAVAGIQAIQPVQPVRPIDADAAGHRDVYIRSMAVSDSDTPIPSSAYNSDGMFVDEVSVKGVGTEKTSQGESFVDVLARIIKAHSRDVEDVMGSVGMSPDDLMNSDNLVDLMDAMNDLSDDLGITKIQDISNVAEEFYRTISKDRIVSDVDMMDGSADNKQGSGDAQTSQGGANNDAEY